jgi:uncharacterized membrane protein
LDQQFQHINHKFIDTLSDGVYSIALTLLGLNVVELVTKISKSNDINAAMLNNWPTFFAYTLGFIVLFSTWYAYHAQTQYVDGTDAWIVWQHGISMAWVALMPFGVALLAQSLNGPNRKWGVFYFGICLFGTYWTTLILFALRKFNWPVTYKSSLPITPEQMLKATKVFITTTALIGLVLVAISLAFPWIALIGYGCFIASNFAPVAMLNYTGRALKMLPQTKRI